MNRDQALNTYIKENLSFLTSLDLDRKLIKSSVRDSFFIKHKKKFGLPKIGEICQYLVKFQIKNGVPSETISDQIDICPVYKDLGNQQKKGLKRLIESNYESTLTDDEIAKIKGTQTYEAIREIEGDKLKQQIESSNKTLLDKKTALEKDIEGKKEEFRNIPSILEEENIIEPEFDPEIEETKSWWERFYLKDNPFPGNKDGLSKIDSSLYDNVVVKTKPYTDLLNEIDKKLSNIFDTAYMLVGGFGYGKTTFQDYLIYYLTNIDVLPIRVTCLRSQPDGNGYLDSFTLRLIKELNREANAKETLPLYEIDTVLELCKNICKTKKGIVVFLDDYHKHRAEFEAVYDFLGNLQILKNELTRNGSNVGFIVSAIPQWKMDLTEHQQMSGFFDSRPIIMPDPTPELITEVFNKRIAAYCYDSSPRKIQLDFVEQVFKKSNHHGNYRDYLNLIIEELENNNLAIVSSPIQIAETELKEIENIYRNRSTVWSPIQKLIYGSKFRRFNNEQIAKCLELLVMVSTQKRINEREKIFVDNAFYFSRLKDVGLITKRKDTAASNGFNWVASKGIEVCVERVYEKFGYYLSDYLLKIFAHKKQNMPLRGLKDKHSEDISSFKKFISEKKNKLPQSCIESIDAALVLYDRFDVEPSDRSKTDQAISDIRTAIALLGSATFEIDGHEVFFRENLVENIGEQWESHHFADEVISETLKKADQYDLDQTSINYASTTKLAKDTFKEILENLKETISDITDSQPHSFGCKHVQSNLNPSNMQTFGDTKHALFSANRHQIFGHISKVTNHLELFFRNYLYLTTNLVFGEKRYFDHVPGNDNKSYAYKNTSASSSPKNLYSGLTRSQYRQIFTQGNMIKSLIYSRLPIEWDTSTWDTFFNIFAEENINTSHQKLDDVGQQSRSRYVTYCKLAVDLIVAMNKQISTIPLKQVFLIKEGETESIESSIFRAGFSLKSNSFQSIIADSSTVLFSKDSEHEHHIVSEDAYNRVKSITLSKIEAEPYVQNLLDIDFISQHYRVSYVEYIFSICYMKLIEELVEIHAWTGSRIRISRNTSERS